MEYLNAPSIIVYNWVRKDLKTKRSSAAEKRRHNNKLEGEVTPINFIKFELSEGSDNNIECNHIDIVPCLKEWCAKNLRNGSKDKKVKVKKFFSTYF